MANEIGTQAALVAGGSVLGWLGNWLLQLRRDKRDAAGAAIDALRETMSELRTEVGRLRSEADEARTREQRCEQRVAELRKELHDLKNRLQAAGLPVPPPGE